MENNRSFGFDVFLRFSIFFLLVSILFPSCYRSVEVAPQELPQLNAAYETVVGYQQVTSSTGTGANRSYSNRSVPVVDKSRIPMKTPAGRLVVINGIPSEVRLTTDDGRKVSLREPFRFQLEMGVLTMLAANVSETTLNLQEIRKAEIITPGMAGQRWEATSGMVNHFSPGWMTGISFFAIYSNPFEMGITAELHDMGSMSSTEDRMYGKMIVLELPVRYFIAYPGRASDLRVFVSSGPGIQMGQIRSEGYSSVDYGIKGYLTLGFGLEWNLSSNLAIGLQIRTYLLHTYFSSDDSLEQACEWSPGLFLSYKNWE